MEKNTPHILYNIKFDPFKDRNDICIKILRNEYGIDVSELHVSPIDTLMNIYHMLIPQKKRMVIESSDFLCPVNVKNGYEQLKFKISNGYNLNLHLSKQIYNPKFNDGMHLEFGLYHLHLGVGVEKDKKGNLFSARSGPILIAHITNDTVYCLGVYEHGSQLWSNSKTLEIIEKNWPYLIENKKITRVTDISPIIEDNDRARLRKLGVNTVVTLGSGVSYSWLGSGIALSGGSAKAGMAVAHANGILLRATPFFIREVVAFDEFKDEIAIFHGDIDLKLICLPDNNITAIDKNSGVIYSFNCLSMASMSIRPNYLPKYAIFDLNSKQSSISININALLKTNHGDSIETYLQYPSIYYAPKN